MRNLRLYLAFQALISAMAWLPVFFLFFSDYLSLKEVLLLEAVYYISVVALEVPSGYFSDMTGRKRTLIISALMFSISYILFFTGSSFIQFAVAQFLLAGGMAFRSGTDTSFHYESLKDVGKEAEYAQREANIYRWKFISMAIAILAGGFLGSFKLSYAYILSFVTAAVALALAFAFKEPGIASGKKETGLPIIEQLKTCLTYIRTTPLGWLFGFTVIMYVLTHIPYEFYQPYLKILEEGDRLHLGDAPIISGILYALTSLIAAWAAGKSIQWRDRIGFGNLLILAAFIQLIVIVSLGALLHPALLIIVLFRNFAMAITDAPLNAAISPRIASGQRATYFSIQSLICRLAFFLTLWIYSLFTVPDAKATWPVLSKLLLYSGCLGLIAILLLLLVKPAKKHFEEFHQEESRQEMS